jgi:hypothetical protein
MNEGRKRLKHQTHDLTFSLDVSCEVTVSCWLNNWFAGNHTQEEAQLQKFLQMYIFYPQTHTAE